MNGIIRFSFIPPLVKILWKFGFELPPPQYCKFWSNYIRYLVITAFAFLVSYLGFTILSDEWNGQSSLSIAVFVSFSSSLLMAGYHKFEVSGKALSNWESL